MEEFKYEGLWWRPEDPNIKIPGTLHFDPKSGGKLELIGTFKTLDDLKQLNREALSSSMVLILGISIDGKALTLYKCFETSFSLRFPGITRSAFFVNIVFIGYHFSREEDILFDEVSINYSNLQEWVGISGFKHNTEFDSADHLKKFVISYETPANISAKLELGHVQLDFHFRAKSTISFAFDCDQLTFFRIIPTSSHDFLWYLNGVMGHIRNFISLAIGKAVYPDTIICKSKSCYTQLTNGDKILADIYVHHRIGPIFEPIKPVYSHEMFFSFTDVASNFEFILNNWINKAEVLQPVYDLYFGTLYNPSLHLNSHFLSLTQAIESYHRRIFGGKYISNESYNNQKNAFIAAILPNTEPSFKESLCIKIGYMNEYSLNRRIKDIMNKYSEILSVVVDSPDSFGRVVTNTRNYLTHYDKKLEPLAKKGQELYWLVHKTRALIEICLLSELGFEDGTIKSLVTRSQRRQELLSH